MSEQSRTSIRIRRQPFVGSKEDQVLSTAKTFYDRKFDEKVGLVLVDVFEPLHVAITTGSEREVRAAIARSLVEIRDWHQMALLQCRDCGYGLSASQSTPEDSPLDGVLDMDMRKGTGDTHATKEGK